MKKSTILFTTTLALITLVCLVPQLVGFIRVQRTDYKTPADFISKLWIDASDIIPSLEIQESFQHIKIIGEGKHNYLHIQYTDSTNILDPTDLRAAVINDTLIINTGKQNYIALNLAHKISSIHAEKTQLRISSEKYTDTLTVQVTDHSTVNLFTSRPWRDSTRASITLLQLDVQDQSKAYINALKIHRVHAFVDNAVLSYDTDLAADTIDVTLLGKSIVRSADPHKINEVGNLIVRKDKSYFKPELIGKNVLLTLD